MYVCNRPNHLALATKFLKFLGKNILLLSKSKKGIITALGLRLQKSVIGVLTSVLNKDELQFSQVLYI